MKFSITAYSEYGRDDADVNIALLSLRPEKALAELLVLDLAIQNSIGILRGELQRQLKPS